MPFKEAEVFGIATGDLLSPMISKQTGNVLGLSKEEIFGLLTLIEKSGRNLVLIPLKPGQAKVLLDIHRGYTSRETLDEILQSIVNDSPNNIDLNKATIHHFKLTNSANKLSAQVLLKEPGSFEADSFTCDPIKAIMLYLAKGTKLLVENELFELVADFDFNLKPVDAKSKEQDADLRERLRKIKPEEFGNFSLFR